eukprot:gene33286-38652_t
MFQSLDFEGNGAINLDELTEAVTYVQQKTKHSKGLEQFQNIQETFIAMDDNGDGTVDFSEFIHAMTGTSQSTFDKATEYDVERLFSYFIEYGELKQREMAYRKISEAQAQSIASPDSPKKDETKLAPSDSLSVKHFKALFGATEESERKYVSRVTAKKQAKEASGIVTKEEICVTVELTDECISLADAVGRTVNDVQENEWFLFDNDVGVHEIHSF